MTKITTTIENVTSTSTTTTYASGPTFTVTSTTPLELTKSLQDLFFADEPVLRECGMTADRTDRYHVLLPINARSAFSIAHSSPVSVGNYLDTRGYCTYCSLRASTCIWLELWDVGGYVECLVVCGFEEGEAHTLKGLFEAGGPKIRS